MKDVDPHHLEAARLALGRAALDAGKLAVLAAIDERATFRADRVVVKVDSDTRRLEHELAIMAVAGGVGLPVPLVMAFENGSPGVLLMHHMPGEALRPAHGPQPVRDAGRLLRRLHALPGERKEAWDLHLSAWADLRTRQLVERRLLHADDAARIRSRVEDVRAILADRPCSLIHDDLQPDHILVDGGRISAFLDFADASGGCSPRKPSVSRPKSSSGPGREVNGTRHLGRLARLRAPSGSRRASVVEPRRSVAALRNRDCLSTVT